MCSCTQIIAKMGFYRCIIRTYVVVFTREIGGRLQLGFDYVIMHASAAELRRFMAAVALRMDQAVMQRLRLNLLPSESVRTMRRRLSPVLLFVYEIRDASARSAFDCRLSTAAELPTTRTRATASFRIVGTAD